MKKQVTGILCIGLLLSASFAARAEVIFEEDFSTASGWMYTSADPRVVGPAEPPLVEWNPGAENLSVAWDASNPTSFYQKPLGVNLTERDDITIRFQLEFSESLVSNDVFWQIGIGLRNGADTEFDRTGGPWPPGDKARNLFEFGYFPQISEYGGPWLQPTICTHDGQIRANFASPARALEVGKNYAIQLTYSHGTRTMLMTMSVAGESAIVDSQEAVLSEGDAFTLNTFGIFVYGDVEDASPGTDRIVGIVDDIVVELEKSAVDCFSLYR